ncbi:uncharacterized protein BDV14DRAFT_23825 [Aspergillus stella-maris]|uniref:uncharacterized protein n=1 Tax=Aspergillus stella-maris TaxID=1810926 RepID=UPI003CCE1877
MMEGLKHENKVLYQILKRSGFKVLCPACLKGFTRTDLLYRHFRTTNDEIHSGLDPMKDDDQRLHSCYQKAIKSSISASELATNSVGGKCFEVSYVIKYYDKDTQSMASVVEYQDTDTSKLSANCWLTASQC